LLILTRPKRIPEGVWASAGAFLLVLLRLISPRDAWAAVGRGTDVYLFLTGMMVLAELARGHAQGDPATVRFDRRSS